LQFYLVGIEMKESFRKSLNKKLEYYRKLRLSWYRQSLFACLHVRKRSSVFGGSAFIQPINQNNLKSSIAGKSPAL